MKRFVLTATVLLIIATMPAAFASDDEGATLFQSNCAGCHGPTGAGLGDTFPPLAGNPNVQDADHVRAVITGGLSGAVEVLGKTYNGVMPPFSSLTPQQVEALIGYVQGELQGTTETSTTTIAGETSTTTTVAAPSAPTGSPDRGEAIFTGAQRLDSGGPACIACHSAGSHDNLGGSTLGPDLTDLNTMFGGVDGVYGVLANPPSPTMQPVFGPSPFSDQERADLAAYFASVEEPAGGIDLLLVIGLIGAVALFGAMLVLGRSRKNYVEQLRSGR